MHSIFTEAAALEGKSKAKKMLDKTLGTKIQTAFKNVYPPEIDMDPYDTVEDATAIEEYEGV